MKQLELLNIFAHLEKYKSFVFSNRDLEMFFPNETKKTLEKSLSRMVKKGLITRAARGVYVNHQGAQRNACNVIEEIALKLRSCDLCYVSLESILSEYGVISQVPLNYLTVMTTGAKGVHKTPYGTIEFTHTSRGYMEALDRSIMIPDRPLRIAKKMVAVQDLRRVGRNVYMMDEEEFDE